MICVCLFRESNGRLSVVALRDDEVHTQRTAASQTERLSQQVASLWQESQQANEQLVSLQRETESLKSALVQQRSEGTR